MEFVQRTLERQLEAMRRTRTSLSPEAAAKAAVLGPPGKALSLAGLRNPVSVAGVSAVGGDVGAIDAFMAGLR